MCAFLTFVLLRQKIKKACHVSDLQLGLLLLFYRFAISKFTFSCKFSRYLHALENVALMKITPSRVNAIFRPGFDNKSRFLKS